MTSAEQTEVMGVTQSGSDEEIVATKEAVVREQGRGGGSKVMEWHDGGAGRGRGMWGSPERCEEQLG